MLFILWEKKKKVFFFLDIFFISNQSKIRLSDFSYIILFMEGLNEILI